MFGPQYVNGALHGSQNTQVFIFPVKREGWSREEGSRGGERGGEEEREEKRRGGRGEEERRERRGEEGEER